MKNNDFDFIKNRFDSVEPSMPDSLNKEILRQKISSNEEHKTIKFEQKKNYFKPIISAAACFILIQVLPLQQIQMCLILKKFQVSATMTRLTQK